MDPEAPPILQVEKRPQEEESLNEGEPEFKKSKTHGDSWDRDSRHGVTAVKKEFIVQKVPTATVIDDDAAEGDTGTSSTKTARTAKHQNRGQNKARKFHFAQDEVKLCQSLSHVLREGLFESTPCSYAISKEGGRNTKVGDGGDSDRTVAPKCRFEHNLREYLKHKTNSAEGVCEIWKERGVCASGWRCRWLGTHSREENGELVLLIDEEKKKAVERQAGHLKMGKIAASKSEVGKTVPLDWEKNIPIHGFDNPYGEIVNNVPVEVKIQIRKARFPLKKSLVYQAWVDKVKDQESEDKAGERAAYREPPPKPEEKRKLYIGRDTPLLAPLTTTGNMPFRRLCVNLGAEITYSEMAMSHSILQGHKPEWALLRAHTSELPHFGAQISANKISQAIRATETITKLFPTAASGQHGLAFVDLNCGCPIDLVYRTGAGSALLDQQNKLVKILKGMNYVSGDTPITVKIRMGTKDNNPTAQKLIYKLIGNGDVQAVTLHGRSRQQRYTRAADWEYIAQTATLIESIKKQMDLDSDTAADKEQQEKRQVYFVGNGDCYSHIDYYNAVNNAKVDGMMLARGALIKPWLFEEIQKGQYLDKSATERLNLIREYCRYGLECWGSDEFGVATTRRFLLEWLSFTHRYVPIGILERLPAKINDRPPIWRGRNELETLLGSDNYKDWIKVSEMFLGPCPEDFFFVPKHKSNSHDDEAEG